MSINLLTDDIINQIAAGEVISNPSGVIKELVENSIDAGSDSIEIMLENAGLSKIVVKDNGIGISKEDLKLAPKRHATSKIKSFTDLYNINSMGFRGEALASMFSVSKARIISRKRGCLEAYEIDSLSQEIKESARGEGTSVIVEDLFYNTPVRKKYLNSESSEYKRVLEILERYQLYYHNIDFKLYKDSKLVINKPSFSNYLDNVYYILGKELKGNLLYIENQVNGINLRGYIANPSNLSYNFRKNQRLYVNSRFIKSKLISDAIYKGLGSSLMEGKHPFYLLFIDIDPEIIDVNVHPTKIEIRFENENQIYQFVKESVEKIFENFTTFKSFEENKPLDTVVDDDIDTNIAKELRNSKKELFNNNNSYYTSDIQQELNFEPKEESTSKVSFEESHISIEDNFSTSSTKDQHSTFDSNDNTLSISEKKPLEDVLSEYRIVGQVNKEFIIIETPKEMFIVDQHAAEEKVNYENLVEKFKSKSIEKQKLLKPEIIRVTNSEMQLYRINSDILDSMGFETEEFGEKEILVRTLPILLGRNLEKAENIKEILHNILVDKSVENIEEDRASKIASMACRMSIMSGDEMTQTQMKTLIEKLKTLEQPFNCPHGRPIFLRYTYKELDKKFKRE